MPSFKFSKKELLIIAALFIAGAAAHSVYSMHYNAEKSVYAEITYNGELAETVPLDKDCTFSINGLPNVIFEVKDGKVAFIQSDCPDKVCINSGWLDAHGHFAACLPNHVVLRIKDGDEQNADGVDGIAR